MRRTKAHLLALCLVLAACGGKQVATQPQQPADSLRTIAVQTDRAATALNAAVDVKRALLKDGLITREQSAALTTRLLTAVKVVRELNEGARTYQSFADGKAPLAALFAQAQSAFGALSNDFLPGLSAQAKDRLNAVLALAGASLTALQPLFGGAK